MINIKHLCKSVSVNNIYIYNIYILRSQGGGLGLWATTIEIEINTGEMVLAPHSARRVSTRHAE